MTANQETEILRMIGDMKGETGEIRGQLREVNHTLVNLSAKFDALALRSASKDNIPDEVEKLKARVTVLEDKESQRTGAVNFGAWLLKTPLVAWVAAAGLAVWALFKGQGQ